MPSLPRLALATLALGLLAGCTSTRDRPAPADPTTGRLAGARREARVLVSEPLPIWKYRSFALEVSDHRYLRDQLRLLGLFDTVYDQNGFDAMIIQRGLGARLGSVNSLLGWWNAAREIGPFLIVGYRIDGKPPFDLRLEFVVTDAASSRIVYKCDVPYDPHWSGVDDQRTFYPLVNGFLDWYHRNDVPPATAVSAL